MSIQYKNKKTGDAVLLETACNIKIDGKWVEGIAYFNANKLREMFVIIKKDFLNEFEEIIDEVEL